MIRECQECPEFDKGHARAEIEIKREAKRRS